MNLFQRSSSTKQHATIAVSCLAMGALIGGSITHWLSVSRGAFLSGVSAQSASSTGRVLGIGQLPGVDGPNDVDFKQFWQVWQMLKQDYYQQPLDDKKLFYGALAGLAQSTGDPYTMYFTPTLASDFQHALAGKFEGIGAELGQKDGQLLIIAPLPDTPASKAGIREGDWIVKIDGKDASGLSVDQAVDLIRGPKGTAVTLTIYRPSEPKKAPYDVSIVRDEIQVKSVSSKMLDKGIAYINATNFNEDTQAGFDQAVTDVLKQHPKGLILDLRNNPGGFLLTARAMAGAWVKDQIVVEERRQGKITDKLSGIGDGRLADMPTVVLVNQGSASASEIVSGALQDYKKATLVGTKTFGKGSVQDYQDLSDGSGIKITVAEWLTPLERTINKTGLTPDVTVERTAEDYEQQRDPQLDRAVGILLGTAPSTDHVQAATSTR